ELSLEELEQIVNQGEGYTISDLRRVFDRWYNGHLIETIYPQYRNVETGKHSIIRQKAVGNAYEELQSMIGLKSAKELIEMALTYYKAQKVLGKDETNWDRPAFHMLFTGNAGTAKTTVARLFAQILKDNGILSEGKLIEVGRADLVGKYVGWTAPTVKAFFKKAKGNVLFIDEAYSLLDSNEHLYGDEAIDTIVQEMENHRNDVVVIFAGYPKMMYDFIARNPGLRSRIGFHVQFDDYSAEELLEIARLIAGKNEYTLEAAAEKSLVDFFGKMRKIPDFGNGRFVRNIIEKAMFRQAARLMETEIKHVKERDIHTLKREDFDFSVDYETNERKAIGF
ncbi:MAG: AAA family ATPase, partial [Bacillota bacterium]|nr:AAA family ATPase [Bacillota bacterium]